MAETTGKRRNPVQASAARLRELVLAREAGAQIGSLREVAALLGVGIVTVQQAARILEHEGLLHVRRGPGGGYYGARPDEAALERSMAAWLRGHGSGRHEALEMVTLLENEMIAAAARRDDADARDALHAIAARIDGCVTPEARAALEADLQALLARMVDRPLVALLSSVTLRHYRSLTMPSLFAGDEGTRVWQTGRRRIVAAILAQDEPLARFEAERHRRETLRRLSLVAADEG